MSTVTSTKRLPSRVATILGIASVVLGVSTSEYFEAGPIVAVAATAVLLVATAFAYNFLSA